MSTSSKHVRSKQPVQEETVPVGKPANNQRHAFRIGIGFSRRYSVPPACRASAAFQREPCKIC